MTKIAILYYTPLCGKICNFSFWITAVSLILLLFLADSPSISSYWFVPLLILAFVWIIAGLNGVGLLIIRNEDSKSHSISLHSLFGETEIGEFKEVKRWWQYDFVSSMSMSGKGRFTSSPGENRIQLWYAFGDEKSTYFNLCKTRRKWRDVPKDWNYFQGRPEQYNNYINIFSRKKIDQFFIFHQSSLEK